MSVVPTAGIHEVVDARPTLYSTVVSIRIVVKGGDATEVYVLLYVRPAEYSALKMADELLTRLASW